MPVHFRAIIVALALLTPLTAWAQAQVAVQDPWSRATARLAAAGAVYFTISNGSGEPDRLTGASSPASDTAELHTHIEEDGVLKMRPVEDVEIPAKGRVTFKPGGLHVMLLGLKAPLKEGKTVPLSLTFEKSGTIEIEAPILPVGAPAPK
jgi:copper(I)-binding protein